MHAFISCHFRNMTVYDQTVFHSDVYSIRHDYFFKHWLDTTRNIVNPVKLIGQVLNYPRKNKYPKNRSALTYWEEDYPSRLDLGKEKYGGPFSVEQVEDVKSFKVNSLTNLCSGRFLCKRINSELFFYSKQNTTVHFLLCLE